MKNELTSARIPPFGGLSEEQRISRICELLSKAVVADWTERAVRRGATNSMSAEAEMPQAEVSDRQRILNYLALVGNATPSSIRETLGLPRMRLYRAVQPMLARGRLIKSGNTSTISYSLAQGKGMQLGLN